MKTITIDNVEKMPMQAPIKISIPFESLVEAIAGLTLENKLQLQQILDQQIDDSQQKAQQEELNTLREKIDEGTRQIHQGNLVDGELVFQRLENKINQMKKG
ncbi:MAG: hypothetical protein F6K09_23755 [Merismopedia sp. SIO2A8]|nr:hypothetical protein [Merismopedia sp. SIO2A8]